MTTKVLLCGVGGQGTILAAHVLADVAMASGLDVKVSEIHGMAQRGGSVTTVVTFGENVESMVCGEGEAQVLVSFDALEALRNISCLGVGGNLIVNDETIKPMSVLTGKASLPSNALSNLAELGALLIPAEKLSNEAGNPKTQNVVMLGALSSVLDFPEDDWKAVIASKVPKKSIDANLEAFRLGRTFVADHQNQSV